MSSGNVGCLPYMASRTPGFLGGTACGAVTPAAVVGAALALTVAALSDGGGWRTCAVLWEIPAVAAVAAVPEAAADMALRMTIRPAFIRRRLVHALDRWVAGIAATAATVGPQVSALKAGATFKYIPLAVAYPAVAWCWCSSSNHRCRRVRNAMLYRLPWRRSGSTAGSSRRAASSASCAINIW